MTVTLVNNHFPVLMVEKVKETAEFYASFFGMNVVFSSDWYVQLRSAGEVAHEIAVMRWDHETVPESKRAMTSGVLMSFEVDDAANIHEKALAEGLPILLSLKDEDFGQRHFMTTDPHGNLVDVITPIEPSKEYADMYS